MGEHLRQAYTKIRQIALCGELEAAYELMAENLDTAVAFKDKTALLISLKVLEAYIERMDWVGKMHYANTHTKIFKSILRIDRQNFHARLSQGLTLLHRPKEMGGRLDKGGEIIAKQYEARPRHPAVLYGMMAYHMRAREWDQALEFADKHLEVCPNDPRTIAYREQILNKEGVSNCGATGAVGLSALALLLAWFLASRSRARARFAGHLFFSSSR